MARKRNYVTGMAAAMALMSIMVVPKVKEVVVSVEANAGGLSFSETNNTGMIDVGGNTDDISYVKYDDENSEKIQAMSNPVWVSKSSKNYPVYYAEVVDAIFWTDDKVLVKKMSGEQCWLPQSYVTEFASRQDILAFAENEGTPVKIIKQCTLMDAIPRCDRLSTILVDGIAANTSATLVWSDEDPNGWSAVLVECEGKKHLGFLSSRVIEFKESVAIPDSFEKYSTPLEMVVGSEYISLLSGTRFRGYQIELLEPGAPLKVLASDGYSTGNCYVETARGNKGFVCRAHINPIASIDMEEMPTIKPSGSAMPDIYTALNEPIEMYIGEVPISLRSDPSWDFGYSKETLLKGDTVTVLGTNPEGWRWIKTASGAEGNVSIHHLTGEKVEVEIVPRPDSVTSTTSPPVMTTTPTTTTQTIITSNSMPDIYTALEVQQNLFVGSVPIDLRSEPDWDKGYALERLLSNDVVTVIATDGYDNGWRWVKTASGAEGNVCAAHLSSTMVNVDIAPPSTSTPEYNTSETPVVQQPSSGRRLLGSYFYELWTDGNSMTNVRLAANAVNANGWVDPWSTWSFHNRVGYCTTEPYVVAGIIGGEARGGGICALTTAMATAAVRSNLSVWANPHTEYVNNVENAKARAMAEGLLFQEAMVSADGSDFHIYSNQNPLEIKVSTDWNQGYGYHWINVEIYEYQ